MAALPQNDQERSADHRLERRHEHAPCSNQLDVARYVFAIWLIKATNLGIFLSVGTNHANTRQIFLNLCGKRSQRSLDLLVKVVNGLTEVAHGDENDRYRKQNPQRQRAR